MKAHHLIYNPNNLPVAEREKESTKIWWNTNIILTESVRKQYCGKEIIHYSSIVCYLQGKPKKGAFRTVRCLRDRDWIAGHKHPLKYIACLKVSGPYCCYQGQWQKKIVIFISWEYQNFLPSSWQHLLDKFLCLVYKPRWIQRYDNVWSKITWLISLRGAWLHCPLAVPLAGISECSGAA